MLEEMTTTPPPQSQSMVRNMDNHLYLASPNISRPNIYVITNPETSGRFDERLPIGQKDREKKKLSGLVRK